MSIAPSLRLKRRATGLIGAGLLVFMTGCNLLPFVSNDERIQISYIRSFKKGLSPTDNKSFGILLREVGKLAGYSMPTKYGIDIAPYLGPFPSVEPISPTVSVLSSGDNATRELKQIYDQGGQVQITFTTEIGAPSSQQAYTYKMVIARTPTGTTGQVAVQTVGSNWTAPPGGSSTWVLGQGKAPQVPSALAFQGQLVLPQGAGNASLRVDLGFEQGGGQAPVPRTASVNFVLQSGLSANLSGSYGSLQAARLNGTVTVKGDKPTPDTYQADISASNGNAQITLISEQRKIRLELNYEDGLLSGVAKATDGRQAELAKFVQEAGKAPEIQYADGTKESWNFTLPAS